MGLLRRTSVAIDGSKFKAVNQGPPTPHPTRYHAAKTQSWHSPAALARAASSSGERNEVSFNLQGDRCRRAITRYLDVRFLAVVSAGDE
jgi:hypothetical protein